MQLLQKYPHIKFVLVLFIISGSSLFAQNDLNYYLSAAYRNNTVINENLNNIRIRNLDKTLNNAQYNLPQISLTANYLFAPFFNNSKLITTTPDSLAVGYDASITNGGLYSAQVNLSKNIFNGRVVDAYNNQSLLQSESLENNIEAVKHSLTRDITDQYLICYQAQQLFEVSAALLDTLEQQLNITRSLMLRGLAKESDYLLLKIEFANQQIASEQIYNSLKTSIYELNTACGLEDTALVKLQIINLEKSGTVTDSRFLKQFYIDSLLTISQQEVLETKYLPQFNLFVNGGLNAVEITGIQRKFGMSAGFNFSLPVFDGNQRDITRQQAKISAEIIGMQKENQRLTVKNKRNEMSSQLGFYSRNLESISSQLKDYEQVIRLSHSEMLNGQLSVIEFITILRNFLELKKNEIQTYTNYQQAINQFNYWNW